YFVQYRCWLCPDKTAFYSDLSFGDDWSRSFYEDKVGTSVVIVRSEQGGEILHRMKENGKIALEEMDPEQLIHAQALPYKMNILKREKIARFFSKAIPQYEGFEFKKEKTSYWAELMMYFRIRVHDSWFSRFMIRMDLCSFRVWRRLKNVLNIRLFLSRVRLVVKKVISLTRKDEKPKPNDEKLLEVQAPSIRDGFSEKVPGGRRQHLIVTVGGYGYNDVGDEAMPRAIIANLKERFENNLSVMMLSPDPAFTTAYHGNPSSKDIIFNYSADDIAGLNFERERYLGWAKVFAKNKLRAFFLTFANFRAPFFKLLRIIDKSHAVLNVGGGNLNSIMRKELYKRTTVHLIAKTLGKKVYISGQTIGPFYHDNDRCIFLESLNSVDILTFRDKIKSRELVKSLGVSQPLMYDAGDDALTLKSIGKEAASDLIKNDSSAAWFALKSKHTWALNLKASLKMFKGAGRSADLSNEINRLAAVGEYILSHYDARVLLVSTDYCAGVDDRVVLKEVYDNIPDSLKNRVNLLNNVYTDHELKGIISFCDFALGARYHFSVFALAQLVPTIGLASGEYQRTKLKGILQLLDLEDYYIPEDMEYASLDNITGTIDKMVVNEKAIRKKLTQNVPLLMKESTKIVEHIYNDLSIVFDDQKPFREKVSGLPKAFHYQKFWEVPEAKK
ncbi:MAG: colanic acid/amylovoran biosynthesis protein, partial [Acidobacteriota bacterium]|nr:colanic acid/amylovoran biosynthesis protein [Acidobacteriota bacterium]